MLILFDENFPQKLAEGIDIIEQGHKDSILQCEITHPYLIGKGGTTDDEWIKFLGENNAIFMTFDKDFKDIKSKGRLYCENQVGVFFFKYDKKDKDGMYWQSVKIFIKNFGEIKRIITEVPRPFVYRITLNSIPQVFHF